MKYFALIGCTWLLLTSSLHAENLEIKLWSEIVEEGVEDFFLGRRPEWIASIPEGSLFPITLDLQSDFFTQLTEAENGISQPALCLRITSPLYVRYLEGVFLISEDLQTWSPADRFFTGTLSFSLRDSLKVMMMLNKRS